MSNGNGRHARPYRRYIGAGIYRYIVQYASEHHGMLPTYREIAEHFAIPSTDTVSRIMRQLRRGGFIDRDEARRDYIVGAQWVPPERV